MSEVNPSAKQWLETLRRWRRLESPEARAAAVLLGVDDLVDEVRVLNNYFGRVQGLVEPADDSDPEPVMPRVLMDNALARIHRTLTDLLCLANQAWNDEEDRDAPTKRRQLIGAYTDAIVASSKAASRLRTGEPLVETEESDDAPVTDETEVTPPAPTDPPPPVIEPPPA
jgi:hypothetical protein